MVSGHLGAKTRHIADAAIIMQTVLHITDSHLYADEGTAHEKIIHEGGRAYYPAATFRTVLADAKLAVSVVCQAFIYWYLLLILITNWSFLFVMMPFENMLLQKKNGN